MRTACGYGTQIATPSAGTPSTATTSSVTVTAATSCDWRTARPGTEAAMASTTLRSPPGAAYLIGPDRTPSMPVGPATWKESVHGRTTPRSTRSPTRATKSGSAAVK